MHPHRQENAQQQASFQADRIQVIESHHENETVTTSTLSSMTSKDSVAATECAPPFVQRSAFIGDNICVTEREQYLTSKENEGAVNLLKYYEFFNGVDSVGP